MNRFYTYPDKRPLVFKNEKLCPECKQRKPIEGSACVAGRMIRCGDCKRARK